MNRFMMLSGIVVLALGITMVAEAAPPAGVTFITEIAGYAGENPYSEDPNWYPSLDVDNDGDLWVCSNGHVFENRDGNWIDHTEASGGGNYVSVTSQGTVWVASSGHLASYDGVSWTDHSEGIPEEIRALSAEGDNIWMAAWIPGSENMYLVHFNGETVNTFSSGLLQPYISRLAASPDGVWIVHHNWYDMIDCNGDNCPKGTSFFDGSEFHHFSKDNGMPARDNPYWEDMTDVPWIVYSTQEEKVFADCDGFLVSYNDGQWPVVDSANGYPLVEGFDGNLWQGRVGIMKGNGLRYRENGRWYSFDFSQITTWIFDDIINGEYGPQWTSSLAVTKDNIAWFGVTGGLVRVDTKQLPAPISTGIEADIPVAESSRIVCYPNPFNGITTIHFDLRETARVEADIYSITGQCVRSLSTGWLPAGSHALQWDGRNAEGTVVSSGMYFISIRAGKLRLTGSMTFVK